MNSQHRTNNRLIFRWSVVGIWLLLTTLFICLNLPWRALASTPALLQTLPPRLVNEQGMPLANAQLRVLCYMESNGRFVHTHDLRDSTNAQGQLRHQLPIDCPRLAVLQELYQQPSGKPGRDAAYTVYNTSWLAGDATPAHASGDVVVRSDQHLVLFDVAVALEWEPGADSSYLNELEQGLRLASGYLYDVTDGQMAFGSWEITSGGQGWESADIRIRAANDYRPSAQVGGMIAAATTYTANNGRSTIYQPGAIVLGRYWDGVNASDPINGAWNQPAAYRTLVHEWLHYALFLYDEYQAIIGDERVESYCSCADLPQVGQNPAVCNQISADLAASVMAYHYTASELWLDGAEASCQNSEQFHVHGASDWETLERWSAIQDLEDNWLRKPTGVFAGPTLGYLAELDGQPAVTATDRRLFLPWLANQRRGGATPTIATTPISAALQATSAMTLNVAVNASLTLTDLLALQVQIYTWNAATATHPPRIVYQGSTTGVRQPPNLLGQATLVGVKPGTQVAVHMIHPGITSYSYFGVLDPAQGQQTIQAMNTPIALNLAVTPLFDGTRIHAYNLMLRSGAPLTTPPVAQLCTPDATINCAQTGGWRQSMIDSGGGITWTTMLTAPANQPFPELGILHLSTSNGDIFRWYETLGGVGPGRIRSYAPRRDGLITIAGSAGFPDEAHLVFLMPTADNSALQAALPPGVSGVSGSPFEIQVLLPSTASNQVVAASNEQAGATTIATPVQVSMFYDGATADRLNLKPNQSQLLQYLPSTGRWQLITPSGRSDSLSWVASQPLSEPGILAVGRMASPDFGLKPELLAEAGKLPNPSPVRVQIVMPAAATVITKSAFVRVPIPEIIEQVEQIQCNFGSCQYDDKARQVLWQGEVDKADLLLFSFELALDDTIPPGQLPKTLPLQATAFDGAVLHTLMVDVSLRGQQAQETATTPTPVLQPEAILKERLPPSPSSICCTTN